MRSLTLALAAQLCFFITCGAHGEDCVRSNYSWKEFEKRGIWLGYPYGMGSALLKCFEVSMACNEGSGFRQLGDLHVGGPVGTKLLISRIRISGKDAKLLKLRLRAGARASELRAVRTPLRLMRHAGTGAYPRAVTVQVKCPISSSAQLDAKMRVSYKLTHGDGPTYTKSITVK